MEHYVDQLANGVKEPQWPDNVSATLKDSSDHQFGGEGHPVRVVTPTASVSTGFSDSEDDDAMDDHDVLDEDNSDVDVN